MAHKYKTTETSSLFFLFKAANDYLFISEEVRTSQPKLALYAAIQLYYCHKTAISSRADLHLTLKLSKRLSVGHQTY